jgi:hypothetical protein
MPRPSRRVIALVLLLLPAAPARAATLPAHGPLRILIVSDEVNPHGLSPAQLTQPGDLSAAFAAPGSGLVIGASPNAVLEVATDDLPAATAALSVPIADPFAYDVLVYFAHRIPNGAGGLEQQADFTAAVEAFLVAGGGVVSFHHGAYSTAGKAGILDVIGGTAAGAVPWNTIAGQNVIDVAPGHFVTTNGIEYTGTVAYADLPRGVPAATYAFFNNVPDERYPNFQLNPGAGTIEMLFASDYDEAGTTHVLGFTHRRPAWAGVVVAWQPGEYQPNALDDLAGNNFQVLANAIVYAAAGGPIGVAGPARGGTLALGPARPNPFAAATTLDFTLAAPAGDVEVAVHDVTGARVRTLARGPRAAGPQRVGWDGRRDDGTAAAAGVYFARVRAGTDSHARRLVLVR